MAARRRITQIGVESCFCLSKFHRISVVSAVKKVQRGGCRVNYYCSLASTWSSNKFDYRQISKLVESNGKRFYLVDTLALTLLVHDSFCHFEVEEAVDILLLDQLSQVRSLEAQGVPSNHAEAITSAMTLVLDDSLENISQNLISRAEMQKIEMTQQTNLSKFKSEVQSSQDHHFTLLQRETQKLQHDIEKLRGELRHEMDKVTAGQRLDLNLERGRIRDELANQSAETSNLTNKLDGEIHALRAHLEAAKNDVMKYCIATLVSISAVGIGMLRLLSINK